MAWAITIPLTENWLAPILLFLPLLTERSLITSYYRVAFKSVENTKKKFCQIFEISETLIKVLISTINNIWFIFSILPWTTNYNIVAEIQVSIKKDFLIGKV